MDQIEALGAAIHQQDQARQREEMRRRRPSFFLRLEAIPSTDIDACARDAVEIANALRVTVMFEFNGIDCMACPDDTPASLAAEAMRLIGTPPLAVGMKRIARGQPA